MIKAFVFASFLACAVAVSTGVSAELSSDNTRNLRGAGATATEAEAAISFSAEHNTHAMIVRAEMESRIRQYQREHPHGFWAMEARAKALDAPHQRMPAVVMEAKHRAASAAKMQATTASTGGLKTGGTTAAWTEKSPGMSPGGSTGTMTKSMTTGVSTETKTQGATTGVTTDARSQGATTGVSGDFRSQGVMEYASGEQATGTKTQVMNPGMTPGDGMKTGIVTSGTSGAKTGMAGVGGTATGVTTATSTGTTSGLAMKPPSGPAPMDVSWEVTSGTTTQSAVKTTGASDGAKITDTKSSATTKTAAAGKDDEDDGVVASTKIDSKSSTRTDTKATTEDKAGVTKGSSTGATTGSTTTLSKGATTGAKNDANTETTKGSSTGVTKGSATDVKTDVKSATTKGSSTDPRTGGVVTKGMMMEVRAAHRAQYHHGVQKTAMEAKLNQPVADMAKFKVPDADALQKFIEKFTAKKGPARPGKGPMLEAQHTQGDSNYVGLGNAQTTGKKLYKTGGGP